MKRHDHGNCASSLEVICKIDASVAGMAEAEAFISGLMAFRTP